MNENLLFGRNRSAVLRTLILSVFLLMFSAMGFEAAAQAPDPDNEDPKVTFSGTNVTLKSLMDDIEKQTGMVFFYNTQEVDVNKRVTINVNGRQLSAALRQLLEPQQLTYRIIGKQIALYPVEERQEQASAAAHNNTPAATQTQGQAAGQQTRQREYVVTGRVTASDTGRPIDFASVVIQGSNRGVVTDEKGEFSVTFPTQAGGALVVTFLGYEDKVVSVAPPTSRLDIVMESTALAIENVVVTGFQNLKRETFTGSSQKISMDNIEMPGISDVSRMLEGKVAGVSIQNVSSTFGSAPKVRIRGATSISGENKPLWVVDGVVLEDVISISNDQLSSGDPSTLLGSSVAGLNPSDIDSFDILKDAAATALYGARAMNGVIVITTKRGKTGAPRISYTGNFTVRSKPRYENFDIMNSADQMAVYAAMERVGFFNQNIVNGKDYGVFGLMHDAINSYDPLTGFGLENTTLARRNFLDKYAKANTDWFDILFTNKLVHEHSLSITSGTERSRTYASLSYMNDGGVTIGDKVSRFTGNFRNDTEITDKISLGVQLVASYRDQHVPGSYSLSEDAVKGTVSRDFDINPFTYAYTTSRTVRAYDDEGNLEFVRKNYAPFNILHELKNNFIDLSVIDIRAQAELNYRILPGLKYTFLGSLRYVNSGQEHTITETSNVAQAYRAADNSTVRNSNPYLWSDASDVGSEKKIALERGGFLNTRDNEMMHYNVRNSLSYNKIWNGDHMHELSVMGGMEAKYTDRFVRTKTQDGYLYYDGGVFVNNPNFALMLADQQTPPMTRYETYERFAAFYLTANYAFDRKYSLDATVRYDGSNALGKGTSARWLPTWNFGAKWNIGFEPFMENITQIDMMSLRASYGLVATMPPATNASALFYNMQTYAPGYSESTITLSSLGNRYLTWEKLYQFNVGLDLSMFNGRLNFNFDYFNRRSFDLIDVLNDSGNGGEISKMGNNANLYSSGLDITIGGTIIQNKDWRWVANFTFGYTKNEIRDAEDLPMVMELVRQTGGNKNGYPVNSLFSIPYTGLSPDSGVPTFNGGYYWNLQSRKTDDLIYHGPVDPPYTGGLNNTVSWKGLSLNIFLSYQWGNYVRMHPAFSANYSDLDAMSKDFKNRWMMTSDTGVYPTPQILDPIQGIGLDGAYPYNYYNYSDARVAKGDFLRLKSLSLTYALPDKWLEKTKVFRSASVQVTGKDIWLIYADKKLNGQDPEFFNTGGVALPSLPQVIFTINLGF